MRQNWGQWRVMFFDDEHRWRSLPLGWTDLAPVDPFVSIAQGRALLRFDDLLRLVQLCQQLADQPPSTKQP